MKRKLKVDNNFTTTLESIGTKDPQEIVIFSHGFGVKRDSKGLFTDLVHALSKNYLSVLFDYNQFLEEGGYKVPTYSEMVRILEAVIADVKKRYPNKKINLVGHSMGCIVSSFANLSDFAKVLYLAPHAENRYESYVNWLRSLPNCDLDLEGETSIERKNGTYVHLEAGFFEEMKQAEPIEQFSAVSNITQLTIIRALRDERIKGTYHRLKEVKGIDFLELEGNHNFDPPARKELINTVAKLFG